MIKFFKKLFGKTEPVVQEVPYKVETPVVEEVKIAPTPVAEKATEAAVKSVAKPARAKKQSAKPKAPRKPKAPKA